jgi:SAM-dependent methyltransferase
VIERREVETLAQLRAAYNAIYGRAEYGEREALYALVLDLLAAQPGGLVFDVGCGAGPFLRYAEERGLRAAGLDLADNALAKARGRGCTRLVLGQGERLPLADGALDRLVCLGNLEHFLDPLAGARELRRVLTPRGRAVVMLPNSRYSGDLWRWLRGRGGPNHHQAIDRFATWTEWQALLERAGLQVHAVRRWDKGKRWKRLFPFGLAYHFVYVVSPGSAV